MGAEILENRNEIVLKGLPISPGVAFGRVCLFNEGRHNNLPSYQIKGKGIEKEKDRFFHAVKQAQLRLDKTIQSIRTRLGDAEAEIFATQKIILEDNSIQKRILSEIENNSMNAESAITQALEYFETRILELDDEYIKERATDIGEVKRRLLDVLVDLNPSFQCSGDHHCQRGKNRIVVAVELTPSLTMEMDTGHTLAFVTEKGGVASHAAILARAMRIPAVSGIKNIHSILFCSAEVLINGTTGEIIIWPSKETVARHIETQAASKTPEICDPIPGYTIMGNLNLVRDAEEIFKNKAEGIGLFRTEFEFLSEGRLLTEDEQTQRYTALLQKMQGLPVYFRLLDIGGDKTADFFNLPEKEENPYLGFRGCRLLLGRPDLFRPQARALARASQTAQVNIMYPMIVDLAQFIKLKKNYEEVCADIPDQNVRHGVMFEVPSACYQADEIFEAADFGSIGSNDLIQYFFAVDRNNELVAYDYDPNRESFWRLLKTLAEASRKTGKPLAVCGEMAGIPKHVAKLKEIGINRVSVSPKLISDLRTALRTKTK